MNPADDPLEPLDPLDPYGVSARPTAATAGLGPRRAAPPPPIARVAADPPRSSLAPALLAALFTGLLMFAAGFLASRFASPDDAARGPEGVVDLRPIDDQLAKLTGRVDDLAVAQEERDRRWTESLGRIEARPNSASPDLTPLAAKLDALQASVAGLPAPPRLDAVESRLDRLDEGVAKAAGTAATLGPDLARIVERLDQQKAALTALADPIKKPPPTSPAAAGPPPESELTRAAGLFRQAQYGPAQEIFTRLQKALPGDARVWYYSALTHGLATNVWTGETERLVARGVELERAGSTTPEQVETAFAGLPQPNAKAWLDYYRRRAR